MEKIRPILYGVADYAQIRKKNAWFVDRTAKIRDLESVAYADRFDAFAEKYAKRLPAGLSAKILSSSSAADNGTYGAYRIALSANGPFAW